MASALSRVASTGRASSVLPVAGENGLAEAPSTLEDLSRTRLSSTINRKDPSFKELIQRFDSLLLQGAALLGMSAQMSWQVVSFIRSGWNNTRPGALYYVLYVLYYITY